MTLDYALLAVWLLAFIGGQILAARWGTPGPIFAGLFFPIFVGAFVLLLPFIITKTLTEEAQQ